MPLSPTLKPPPGFTQQPQLPQLPTLRPPPGFTQQPLPEPAQTPTAPPTTSPTPHTPARETPIPLTPTNPIDDSVYGPIFVDKMFMNLANDEIAAEIERELLNEFLDM